jgi:hypothetical protein
MKFIQIYKTLSCKLAQFDIGGYDYFNKGNRASSKAVCVRPQEMMR